MTQNKQAWLKMTDWCARQERCVYEAKQKLDALQVEEQEQERILKKLSDENYLNEERFVRFYVRDKFRYNGWGRIKIQWQLSQKKIAAALISEALEELDAAVYESTLMDLLTNKNKTIKGKDKWQTKAALLRFAQSRGFEYDLTNRLIQQIIQ